MTYAWRGGTNYSFYTSLPAGAGTPLSMSLEQNVVTNQGTYKFIVDSMPRQYTISLHVTYQNGATGDATLTFTSDAPTGSLGVAAKGIVTTITTSTNATVTVGNLKTGSPAPMIVNFTASTDQYTSGQFMIMQIINHVYCQYTDNTGQSWYETNDSRFPGFDGPLHDANALAYFVFYGPPPNKWVWPLNQNPPNPGILTYYSLSVTQSTPVPGPHYLAPYMVDSPLLSVPINYGSVTLSDDFSDYLMYKSDSGNSVWIAVSQLGWSFSATATNAAGMWMGPTNQPVTVSGPTKPSGAAAFPPWVNTAQAFIDLGFSKGP